MDACDQTDMSCPYLGTNVKTWASSNDKTFSTKMGAVMFHGSGERPGGIYFYHVDQFTVKGGNFWCTALVDALAKHRETLPNKTLPRRFYLQVDSSSENKNYSFAGLTQLLVMRKIFDKVKISFLPVGHTHEDIDAVFGRASQNMHKSNVPINCFADCFNRLRESNSSTRAVTPIVVSDCKYFSRTMNNELLVGDPRLRLVARVT